MEPLSLGLNVSFGCARDSAPPTPWATSSPKLTAPADCTQLGDHLFITSVEPTLEFLDVGSQKGWKPGAILEPIRQNDSKGRGSRGVRLAVLGGSRRSGVRYGPPYCRLAHAGKCWSRRSRHCCAKFSRTGCWRSTATPRAPAQILQPYAVSPDPRRNGGLPDRGNRPPPRHGGGDTETPRHRGYGD